MSRLSDLRQQAFAALEVPNYRLYVGGQAISLVGTWMQSIAQSWLVLQLTGSATAIGVVVALQTLPLLFLGPYGGLVADRVDKRRFLIGLQAGLGLLALVLGLLAVTGHARLWHVFVLAFLLGLDKAFENPTRQSFVLEMVGPDHLRNAVSLNSVLVNVARAVGPAVAGVVIALGGTGVCFLVNAVSYLAVIASLVRMDTSRLRPSPPAPREKGQLREGLRYVRRTPGLLVPLLMMAIVGCLAYEFQVVLPLVAEQTFGGDSRTYGFMTAAMGIGAVAGGLVVAARGTTGTPAVTKSAAVFGVAIAAAAASPYLWVALIALAATGAASVTFMAKGNTTLQLQADPQMRGRVMGLWSVAFLGSTPIGGPLAGWVAEQFGARAGLVLGAVGCALAVGIGLVALRRLPRAEKAAVADREADVEVADEEVLEDVRVRR